MEVKGHLITSMGLGAPDVQGCQDSKLRAERVAALQERKQALEALLSSRVGELKHVCLQEAELTGKLSHAFPLDKGEKPPVVQRRAGLPPNTKAEDEAAQRKQMKAIFTGALYRHSESDRNVPNSKRTVHRGCHTEDTVMSESTSSMSDSTSHDNESSPSVVADQRSLSQPRLTVGSPDHRISRKLSPVEIYYEMRTRRNSVTSSVSPTHSLPRSASNIEGRSVPATPLLARTAPISVHEGSSSDRRGCPYSSGRGAVVVTAQRPCWTDRASRRPGPRNGMPPRGGPQELRDTDRRQAKAHPPGQPRENADGNLLMDYIWGKQQRMQHHLYQSTGRIWLDAALPSLLHRSSASPRQRILPLPVNSPAPRLLSAPWCSGGPKAELRRVKVTRTKSCGPFIPLQQHAQDAILLSAYDSPLPASGTTTSSIPNLHPYQTELSGPSFGRRPLSSPSRPQKTQRGAYISPGSGGSEGLVPEERPRLPSAAPKGNEAGVSRLSHPHPLVHQQSPGSASFHGHPLHGRSMEFSLYQETPHPQTQEATPKEPSPDPGTLV
ncbi:hypothetical protein KUCAC02_029832 [Chaenocephalus aceratus]|uniref:Uncharacterized protein n=1 Tax=Chaenocephalus aceratus TaxID=36190 RepID=A0ACB9XHY7_CHAAC|nr:hypothetical protein KUCAC02_029832 [Chaenocephalus aceratus]